MGAGYPKVERNEDAARELAKIKSKSGAGSLPVHGKEFHLDPVGDHDWLENITAYDHHGHADQEVKNWNGTDTAWTLAHTPVHGVLLLYKPVDGAYLIMDPEADYTLVGAVITPTVKPGNGDKTRVESYEYATV